MIRKSTKLSASITVVKVRRDKQNKSTNLGFSMKMVNHIDIPPWQVTGVPAHVESSIHLHESLPLVVASFRSGQVYVVDYMKWTSDAVFQLSAIPAHPTFCSLVAFVPGSSSDIVTAGADGVKLFNHRTGQLRLFFQSQAPVSLAKEKRLIQRG